MTGREGKGRKQKKERKGKGTKERKEREGKKEEKEGETKGMEREELNNKSPHLTSLQTHQQLQ